MAVRSPARFRATVNGIGKAATSGRGREVVVN
jgi:hypothetical protein